MYDAEDSVESVESESEIEESDGEGGGIRCDVDDAVDTFNSDCVDVEGVGSGGGRGLGTSTPGTIAGGISGGGNGSGDVGSRVGSNGNRVSGNLL